MTTVKRIVRPPLDNTKRIVIKIGSGVLVRRGTRFDRGTFCRIVEQVAHLVESGLQVALVSSGAVALGLGRVGGERPDRHRELPRLQAMAAIGQTTLMQVYDTEFYHYDLRCGQILLTREDLDNRTRYLNARQTLRALWELGAVPIINENDTIATEEIQFGDNDQLAARVACLVSADLLFILSDVDALYTCDPRLDPAAHRIALVHATDPQLDDYVSDTTRRLSGVGTGGMTTKLEAARIAGRRGIPTIILSGKHPERIHAALQGEDIGTMLIPAQTQQTSRKAWIDSLRVRGQVRCDKGAVDAIRNHGKSLLPSGIVQVEGRFVEGDAIELCDANGKPFARGLAIYPAVDVLRIYGVQSGSIENILGYRLSDAIVHRDDLVILSDPYSEGN